MHWEKRKASGDNTIIQFYLNFNFAHENESF